MLIDASQPSVLEVGSFCSVFFNEDTKERENPNLSNAL